ncbi:MAG TPA: WG repeat-containing protein [Bacteroidia bacterium]|nr:WG repeat-containing protein [Bacteroidia bacterium]
MRTKNLFTLIAAMLFAAASSAQYTNVFYEKGKAGLKNSVTGEVVVPAKYLSASNMIQLSDGSFYSFVYDGAKVGYINDHGEVIIPFIFEEASIFSDGLAKVKMNGKYGYINTSGQLVIPCNYVFAAGFHSNLSRVEQNGKYGFIDRQGNIVLGFNYYNAGDFADGVAPVMNEQGMWGFINAQGNFVIQPSFIKAESFKNGEAIVHNGEKIVYINTQGKVLREHDANH